MALIKVRQLQSLMNDISIIQNYHTHMLFLTTIEVNTINLIYCQVQEEEGLTTVASQFRIVPHTHMLFLTTIAVNTINSIPCQVWDGDKVHGTNMKLLRYLESLPFFLMFAIILINNAE